MCVIVRLCLRLHCFHSLLLLVCTYAAVSAYVRACVCVCGGEGGRVFARKWCFAPSRVVKNLKNKRINIDY